MDLGIVTKSDLILRDLKLLRRIAEQNRLFVNLTVTTVNTQLARILEPRAPRPDLRLGAVHKLVEAGVPAGVIVAPVMPGITDGREDLEQIVRATVEAGGRYIYANPLFLKPCSAAVFMPFLEREFPHMVENYRKRYEGRAFVSSAYRQRLSELMAGLCRKYGLSSVHDRRPVRNSAEKKRPAETNGCGAVNRKKQFAPRARAPLLDDQMTLFE
jgi:DNA repair photolyase